MYKNDGSTIRVSHPRADHALKILGDLRILKEQVVSKAFAKARQDLIPTRVDIAKEKMLGIKFDEVARTKRVYALAESKTTGIIWNNYDCMVLMGYLSPGDDRIPFVNIDNAHLNSVCCALLDLVVANKTKSDLVIGPQLAKAITTAYEFEDAWKKVKDLIDA